MASDYHAALLLRLRHIVGVRQSPRLWKALHNEGQFMLYQMLKAATEDAADEGLDEEILDIVTPEQVKAWT